MSKNNENGAFAVLGAASGLGSAVRFPAMCLEYGACFVLSYAVVLISLAVPLLAAELRFGTKGGRTGGFVRFAQRTAAVNSALIALYYGYPSVSSCLSALDFVGVKGGGSLTFVCALIAFAGAFALLVSGGKSFSHSARITVCVPPVLFSLIAVRSPVKVFGGLSSDLSSLLCGGIWADSLGQAMLSLSLAAGVMPTFARSFKGRLSPFRLAAEVAAVNLAVSVAAAFAVLPYAGDSAFGQGIASSFSVYAEVIRAVFGRGVVGRAFGFLFFLSLFHVAVQSCASLALPLVKSFSPKGKAAFCALGCLFAPFFFLGNGEVYSALDRAACTVNAPLIAFAESLSFVGAFSRPRVKAALACLSAAFGAFALFSVCGARVFAFPFPLSALSAITSLCVISSGVLTNGDLRVNIYLWKIRKIWRRLQRRCRRTASRRSLLKAEKRQRIRHSRL